MMELSTALLIALSAMAISLYVLVDTLVDLILERRSQLQIMEAAYQKQLHLEWFLDTLEHAHYTRRKLQYGGSLYVHNKRLF